MPKAGKPPDTCLPSMYRQAQDRHKPTYQTSQKDCGQAPGTASLPPASPSCRLYESEAIGALRPGGNNQ